tara:strand:+ start:72878 stop:73048 length:171 start_codon:yes stop_codon:yes gene_type:complete
MIPPISDKQEIIALKLLLSDREQEQREFNILALKEIDRLRYELSSLKDKVYGWDDE